ncbi:MAG TPA: diphthine--ammonia ligase [Chitinophagales bacterium]|nr:diphthine--ammonia ligase [Chitinophagales bacterium]
MTKPKAIFCWSGGKDSSLCLYKVLQQKEYEVCYLLTTINGNNHRISMHGVREELLDAQAASIGIPQLKVLVYQGNNAEYENAMGATLAKAQQEGITHVIFGDIFLEDLRQYREDNLAKVGLKAVFPLWKQETGVLINEFLLLGFKTVTCCINDACLTEEHVGRTIDAEFIRSLPEGVDVCGENGEFHTFCYDGPIFKTPVDIMVGEKIYKPLELKTDDCDQAGETKGFWFAELILKEKAQQAI